MSICWTIGLCHLVIAQVTKPMLCFLVAMVFEVLRVCVF